MNKIELLFRWVEMKWLRKKYCNWKTRNGHDFNYADSNNKPFPYRLVFFKCSICEKKAYLDFTGELTLYDQQ